MDINPNPDQQATPVVMQEGEMHTSGAPTILLQMVMPRNNVQPYQSPPTPIIYTNLQHSKYPKGQRIEWAQEEEGFKHLDEDS